LLGAEAKGNASNKVSNSNEDNNSSNDPPNAPGKHQSIKMVSKSPDKTHSKPPLSAREPTVFSPPKLDDSISFSSPKHSPKLGYSNSIFSPHNSPLTTQQLYPQHQQSDKTIKRTSSQNAMIGSKSSPHKTIDKSSTSTSPLLPNPISSPLTSNAPPTIQRTSTVNLVLPVSSTYESKLHTYSLQQPSITSPQNSSHGMGDYQLSASSNHSNFNNNNSHLSKKDDSFTLNSPNTKLHESMAAKLATPSRQQNDIVQQQQPLKSMKRTGSHGIMIGSSSNNLKTIQKQLYMSPRSSDF